MPSSNPDIALFKRLASQNSSLNWYAIADSAQHSDLPARLESPGRESRCLFAASQGGPVAKLAPHLVELPSPLASSNVWSWVSLHGSSKSCVSVIAATLPFDNLFGQLAACTEVTLPDGDSMFFAFWDPAILGTLVGQPDDLTLHVKGPVLSSDQRSMLVQGLGGWWYWDRDGRLHEVHAEPATVDKPAGPITLTQQQVDDLVEASVPDHVLYYLELNQSFLISDISPTQRYALVQQALDRARDLGLFAMSDLVNYVCVELIYKQRMRQDRHIVDIFDQVKHGRLSFHDALEVLP